jgi:hypothetical protein
MAQLKNFQTGTGGDSFNGPVGSTTASTGAFTTLSASSTTTLSGGTANGVAYLNGSKVVTTGSALTFDGSNFAVTGGLITGTKGSSNGLTIGDVSTNSNALLRLQGTSAGYNFLLANNLNVGGFEITPSTATGGTTYSNPVYSVTGLGLHKWFNGTTQAMTLDASGRLQIGTTSSGAGQRLIVDSSGANTVYNSQFTYSAATNTAYCATTWTHGQSGTATGYVGVGGSAVSNSAFQNNFVVGTQSSSPLVFNTNDTERARIDSSGNLLVGTTTATGKFTSVSSTTTPAGYLSTSGVGRVLQVMSTAGADSAQPGIYIGKYANDSTTSQRFMLFSINNDANGSGQINANGASQAAFGSFSDARLKENIVDLAPQLSNIMALRPVEFDYKTGGHQTGFIAQEMQQVFPDAVGNDGSEDQYLTVTGWNKTEAILVKAIQEQQAIITSLTARITALEA